MRDRELHRQKVDAHFEEFVLAPAQLAPSELFEPCFHLRLYSLSVPRDRSGVGSEYPLSAVVLVCFCFAKVYSWYLWARRCPNACSHLCICVFICSFLSSLNCSFICFISSLFVRLFGFASLFMAHVWIVCLFVLLWILTHVSRNGQSICCGLAHIRQPAPWAFRPTTPDLTWKAMKENWDTKRLTLWCAHYLWCTIIPETTTFYLWERQEVYTSDCNWIANFQH